MNVRRRYAIPAGLILAAATTAAAGVVASRTTTPAPSPAAATIPATPDPTPPPTTTPPAIVIPTPSAAAYVPKAADYHLTLTTLERECYGDVGCNVTYRVAVKYTGPDLDPTATYEVRYRVTGGDSGPVDNRLTTTGDVATTDAEEYISTPPSLRLRVKATGVEQINESD
jgi:hypothetical protein